MDGRRWDEQLRLERLLAHRELQELRAAATMKKLTPRERREYFLRRARKTDQARRLVDGR